MGQTRRIESGARNLINSWLGIVRIMNWRKFLFSQLRLAMQPIGTTRPAQPNRSVRRFAGGEATFEIEVVADRGMNSGKFLQGLRASKMRYLTLSSSERLV